MTIRFESLNGSSVEISGEYLGIYHIDYDWVDEGGCCDARPDFNGDFAEPAIVAYCDCHEPHRVKLERIR
jgi:hypothetical protein